jgi:hypothetical protein
MDFQGTVFRWLYVGLRSEPWHATAFAALLSRIRTSTYTCGCVLHNCRRTGGCGIKAHIEPQLLARLTAMGLILL